MATRELLPNTFKYSLLLTNSRISRKRLYSRIIILLVLLVEALLFSSLIYRKILYLLANEALLLIFY